MNALKKNIYFILLMSLVLIMFEIFIHVEYLSLLALSFIFVSIGIIVDRKFIKNACLTLGFLILLVTLFLTKSIWFFFLTCFIFWMMFKADDDHELFFTGERMIFPFKTTVEYVDVIIRPQSEQRCLVQQQPLKETMLDKKTTEYIEDNINMNFFTGNTIIDLGNSFLSNGEKTVMIQKIYGRTRIILPRDMGLQMNISMIHGSVMFEQQNYFLQNKNFQWRTPQYQESVRRINLMMTVAFGDVEVIIL